MAEKRDLIFAAVVVAALAYACNMPSPTPSPSASPEPTATRAAPKVDEMALMACLASQREVKKQLKAPASAEFPSCSWSLHEYKITANEARTRFGVQGYVDSQNSYGANIRSRFVVLLDKGVGDGSGAFTASKVAIE